MWIAPPAIPISSLRIEGQNARRVFRIPRNATMALVYALHRPHQNEIETKNTRIEVSTEIKTERKNAGRKAEHIISDRIFVNNHFNVGACPISAAESIESRAPVVQTGSAPHPNLLDQVGFATVIDSQISGGSFPPRTFVLSPTADNDGFDFRAL